MKLENRIEQIHPISEEAMERARERWSHVAKPLGSLGLLEDAVVKIAGIQGQEKIRISKKALVIMCADNGIVEEGVTQTGQEVTGVVTENFTKGRSCVCIMARRAGVQVVPVDIGVAGELKNRGSLYPLVERKIAWGTKNFMREPAMTREETLKAIETGIQIAEDLKRQGYDMLAVGEMGIGNTTTSAATASVLLGEDPKLMTGRGAGLSDEGLERKKKVIRQALAFHRPDPHDPVDVLSKVGGLDLAGLAGICLGGAIFHMPVVLDGFITSVAALAACGLHRGVSGCLLASHVSAEPAGRLVLERLGLKAPIDGGLCLGEGTGAMAFMPMISMAADIYQNMGTFQDIDIKEYVPLS
ncbi:MAG: nicotinate-nucleotide--dimethylbenzimidazole phosphoribosyltransferase [Hungatella sp.]|jgi:nicotinate-nucleotide--dimethylbenzimidazole phosphoribosyltransferase|nr:nicotinate-nucleotide--dimethylbenzimidazole phosphoribosyltransferase [Hungatella sp.]